MPGTDLRDKPRRCWRLQVGMRRTAPTSPQRSISSSVPCDCFLMGIPKELEEAAMVDGSTRLGAFVRILLPLVAPGLVATSVFAFITSWNEYIFARLLLNDGSTQTITVWLSYYTGSSRATDFGGLMAASTLIAIPVVLFFLLVQRRIAFGLTAGAVRG